MVRCWIHGSIGNCNPTLVRLICQGDMVSLNPCRTPVGSLLAEVVIGPHPSAVTGAPLTRARQAVGGMLSQGRAASVAYRRKQ